MRNWLKDLRQWVWLVISDWRQYAESGLVALVWSLSERFKGKPLSWHVLEVAGIAFLGFAFFNVWRDEANGHRETIKKLEAAMHLPHTKIFEGYHELAKERMQLQDEISEMEAKVKHRDLLDSMGMKSGLEFLRGPSDADIMRDKVKRRKQRVKEIEDILNG